MAFKKIKNIKEFIPENDCTSYYIQCKEVLEIICEYGGDNVLPVIQENAIPIFIDANIDESLWDTLYLQIALALNIVRFEYSKYIKSLTNNIKFE